ncbi:MAG TPA: ComF family protein [Desulfobacterales bacterium]|nr:ComF family protein [Desulfobacterales bacterium]
MNLPTRLSNLGAAILDVLFPARCLLCNERTAAGADILFCPSCGGRLTIIQPPLCPCCGRLLPDSAASHLCGACLRQRPAFSKARALFIYDKFSAPLIHDFKYRGRTTGRRTFNALLRRSSVRQELKTPDLIIPVPLHHKRLRQRGFNQALTLARSLFPEDKRIIRTNLLVRRRWTTPQASLNGHERRKNLRNAFITAHAARVKGKNILLIDDVFTTGSTLNECAATLRHNGAHDIEALTLARVLE